MIDPTIPQPCPFEAFSDAVTAFAEHVRETVDRMQQEQQDHERETETA